MRQTKPKGISKSTTRTSVQKISEEHEDQLLAAVPSRIPSVDSITINQAAIERLGRILMDIARNPANPLDEPTDS